MDEPEGRHQRVSSMERIMVAVLRKRTFKDLKIIAYWLHLTRQQIGALKAKGAMLEALAWLEKSEEDGAAYLKEQYAELGIHFIPCCDCGSVGGVLKQLWDGRYRHLGACK